MYIWTFTVVEALPMNSRLTEVCCATLQSELGDVVYVELPEVGSDIKKGDTYGVVESVKAASDVYSPISGEVVEINSTLVDDPSKVNSEPFEGGWMIKVKLSDPAEIDDLLDASAYKAHCEEGH